jgi:excisionase family DNA binding protein
MAGDESLSTGEAAALLGLTARRLHQMCQRGEIDATQGDNGRWRIPRSAVSRLLRERLRERSVLARMAPEIDSGIVSPTGPSDPSEREIGRLEGKLDAMREYVETLRAELRRERDRADRLQRELDRLRDSQGHGG